eukprot:3797605-Prymnesium_polylepis.1
MISPTLPPWVCAFRLNPRSPSRTPRASAALQAGPALRALSQFDIHELESRSNANHGTRVEHM